MLAFMKEDSVDQIIGHWRAERPDIDVSPLHVFGRVTRIEAYLSRVISDVFEPFGLTRGEFDVLATLRRAGGQNQLTPTALMRSVMLSSGAMTNRIDRLEAAGLVERRPDPSDRRGTLVTLTPEGRALVDSTLQAGLQAQRQLLKSLSDDEQRCVAGILRKLLVNLEAASND
jgi:DNA-binding MarR family transcriptional regulator